MTEDQHIKLVKLGNNFWYDLGELAAKYIAQMPEEIEAEVTMYLQDKCSIYSTMYSEKLIEKRKENDT